MSRKILITGPSGSGKSFISRRLKTIGINALDADELADLHSWVDGNGNKVKFPENADEDFLNNHSFIWFRNYLENFLANQKTELYLFGMSGNVLEMRDLFDDVYYLYIDSSKLKNRLINNERKNPMGKTEYQQQVVIEYKEELDRKAKELGIKFIDAELSPLEIYERIK